VSVQEKVVVHDLLSKNHPDIKLLTKKTEKDALYALVAGESDAYVGNLTVGSFNIQSNSLNNVKIASSTGFDPQNLSMAVRSDWPELASIINKTLTTFTPAEHVKLRSQWSLPIRYEYGLSGLDVVKWVAGVSSFLGAIIAIILWWNKRLVREIDARTAAETKLIQSEKRLRLSLSAAKAGSWHWDIESDEVFFDDRMQEMFGFEPGGYDGTYETWKNAIHPDDAEEADKQTVEALRTGMDYDFEYRLNIESVNGRWRTVKAQAVVISNEKNERMQMAGFCEDITERKQAEDDRLRLDSQLHQSRKMEAIGTMAGGIAHDFNNLLAIIGGNLDLINVKSLAGTPVDENLGHIKEASIRAKNLVDQILSFSRQEEQELIQVDLAAFVGDSLCFLRPMIPTTVEILAEASEVPVFINADTTQLQQVLINLCTNAIHAMNEKGLLRISLEEAELNAEEASSLSGNPKPGHYAKLSVTDTGKGMDKQTIDRIFDPFFTTKSVGEGTGMGLSVVHGIIEKHGGFVHVDSTFGQCTTFALYFPITSTVEMAEEIKAEEALQTGAEHILLVDDEPLVADVCGAMLEHLGYKVTVVNSGVEALGLFKGHPGDFDLIMTDQTMPQMSGTELAKELLGIRPEIPIVICSGYSAKVNEADAKRVGARAFCPKPIAMPQLASVVREALDASELQLPMA